MYPDEHNQISQFLWCFNMMIPKTVSTERHHFGQPLYAVFGSRFPIKSDIKLLVPRRHCLLVFKMIMTVCLLVFWLNFNCKIDVGSKFYQIWPSADGEISLFCDEAMNFASYSRSDKKTIFMTFVI